MKLLMLFFVFIGLIVRNIHLSKVLFYDWDEGMYAQIAREVIKNKSLFTTFNGHLWLDKPPLSHALIAGSFLVFGQTEFWSRFIFIIVAMTLLILTFLVAQKIARSLKAKPFDSIIASLLAVLTLAGSPTFLERTTLLNTDTLVAVSWMGYFLCWDSYWGKLFFLILGVWSKSILGFYPLVIEILYWIFILKKRPQNIFRTTLLFVLPSLWYIAGILKYGQLFLYEHFTSQVFKRLTVPIELHFGGKYYYFQYLWEKLHIIILIILASYIYFAVTTLKERKKINWTLTLPLLAPLPFLLLLTFMKTKIYWYVIIFLPFLTLSLTYLYLTLNNKILCIGLVTIISVFFLINFLPETYFLKTNYQPPEKIALALCLAKQSPTTLGILVDEQERKNRNFLEAAHYDTTSSFYYGGSPSFVYYSQKKVHFYYDPSDFTLHYREYPLLVFTKQDATMNLSKFKVVCETEHWLAIVK